MVFGDFEKDQAKKVVEMFNSKTGTVGINRAETFELAHLQLEKPEDIQYVDNLLVNNSCFFRKYEIGKDSPKTRAMSMVIDKVLQQPFYTEMRTNQQLGYIVWSYTRNIKNTYFLTSGSGGGPSGCLGERTGWDPFCVCLVLQIYGAIYGAIYPTRYGTINVPNPAKRNKHSPKRTPKNVLTLL